MKTVTYHATCQRLTIHSNTVNKAEIEAVHGLIHMTKHYVRHRLLFVILICSAAGPTGICRTSIKAACSKSRVNLLPFPDHGALQSSIHVWTRGPWNLCCDVAVVLEEIEMPLDLFLKIVSLCASSCHTKDRDIVPLFGLDPDPQLMRRFVGIENLSHNPPGRSYPQSQCNDVMLVHVLPPSNCLVWI